MGLPRRCPPACTSASSGGRERHAPPHGWSPNLHHGGLVASAFHAIGGPPSGVPQGERVSRSRSCAAGLGTLAPPPWAAVRCAHPGIVPAPYAPLQSRCELRPERKAPLLGRPAGVRGGRPQAALSGAQPTQTPRTPIPVAYLCTTHVRSPGPTPHTPRQELCIAFLAGRRKRCLAFPV
jgi:hypothetical protein